MISNFESNGSLISFKIDEMPETEVILNIEAEYNADYDVDIKDCRIYAGTVDMTPNGEPDLPKWNPGPEREQFIVEAITEYVKDLRCRG